MTLTERFATLPRYTAKISGHILDGASSNGPWIRAADVDALVCQLEQEQQEKEARYEVDRSQSR